MKAATVIVLAIIMFLIIQWQITGISVENRKDECKIVKQADGSLRAANDYDYYTCISQ
jgi:hypothetical protein